MIRNRRVEKKAVTKKRIQRYARLVFPKLYKDDTFKASEGWLNRFMKRNNVVQRCATSVGQKVPIDAPEICEMFLDEMKSLPSYEYYYNMDETPCYFDVPRSKTYDFRGVSTVKLKTTGHEKLRFTAALTAGVKRISDGRYEAIGLPPLLNFKILKKPPAGKFPPGMVVLGSKGEVCAQNSCWINTFPKYLVDDPVSFLINQNPFF